ncbi:hypothetical protein JJK96_00845 [Staphylococcus haemolyticus]|uniref:hypothetical protein n=1 Tax=Staphylococcus haemolyticus TaxID=1283 RepID=UPI00190D20F2|nr:hypothetical protein [Staphylococcus haemolyticus]MBK3954656.1 hypothetical protein [Staphylococcus haemolyticus]
MENDKEIKYQKVKLRFLYVSIILILIIISLISLFFYRSVNAWLFLSFAGTAISIVLSVIAILITLIDVAGQRQQIADISESAKTLSESTETLKQSIEDYQNDKNEIKNIINTALNESIGSKLEEYTNNVVNSLDALKNNVGDNKEFEKEIQNIKDSLRSSVEKERNNFIDSKVRTRLAYPINGKLPINAINEIKKYILDKNLILKSLENNDDELVIKLTNKLTKPELRIVYLDINSIVDDWD